MQQLSFAYELDNLTLKSYLEKATQKQISLVITNNTSSVLSYRIKGDTVSLRLHNRFMSADNNVIDEIACFIRNSKKKTPLLRRFINDISLNIRKKPRSRIRQDPFGKHYNLRDIFNAINREYFQHRISANITWGSRGPKRVARNRTLGSYNGDDNSIRINPILDNRRVPRYFIEFIVYHEMLHADIGIEKSSGRRSLHSGQFKEREKMFRYYERAIAWEKKRW